MALAPRGMCDCKCHVPGQTALHAVACCERSGMPDIPQPEQPKWTRPETGWIDLGREDRKKECRVCGKVQWEALHSCGGFPKTDAAQARWEAG